MRKGYSSELRAKKELERKYGEGNVIKIAISQIGPDFLVLEDDKVIKVVEVKECHAKTYHPSKTDKRQVERIKKWCFYHHIMGDMWIYLIHGNKTTKKEVILYIPLPREDPLGKPYSPATYPEYNEIFDEGEK